MLSLLLGLSAGGATLAAAASVPFPAPAKRATTGDGFVRYLVTAVADTQGVVGKRQLPTDTTNYGGTLYTVDLEMGTPPQAITVLLDTGSSELWVNPTCATSGSVAFCNAFPQYDKDASSSYWEYTDPFHVSYGKGEVDGVYANDFVIIGGGYFGVDVCQAIVLMDG